LRSTGIEASCGQLDHPLQVALHAACGIERGATPIGDTINRADRHIRGGLLGYLAVDAVPIRVWPMIEGRHSLHGTGRVSETSGKLRYGFCANGLF
jgi:hypothetical protein